MQIICNIEKSEIPCWIFAVFLSKTQNTALSQIFF